jgi:hypothetical protein
MRRSIDILFVVALAAVATIAFCSPVLAATQAGDDITVNNVIGTGSTRDSAVNDARRAAIEQGIGAFIDAYTTVKDFAVVTDKVFSTAQGIIKNFEILDERKDNDGMFVVEARAVVAAAALDAVLGPVTIDMLGNPRVMVMVDERIADKPQFIFTSEGEVESVFQNSGLQIVDESQAEAIMGINLNEAREKQNDEELLRIARNFQADILVSGRALAGSFVSVERGGHPVFSGRASIQLKAVLTNTAQQVDFQALDADQNFTLGTTAEDAAINGFKHCSPIAAKAMVNRIAYSMFGSLGAPTYRIQITGIPFNEVRILKEGLEIMDEVTSVYQRSYRSNTLELDVVSELDANALAEWLYDKGVNIGDVSSQGVTGGWGGEPEPVQPPSEPPKDPWNPAEGVLKK